MGRRTIVSLGMLAVLALTQASHAVANTVVLSDVYVGDYEVPPGTELVGADGARVVGRVILREGSTVRNVEITGWTNQTWNFSAGVMIRGSNATVEDCIIHDGPSHGVMVIGGFTGARIISNQITNVGTYLETGGTYPVANWRGISLEKGSNGALVQGNTITDAWENGIFDAGSTGVVIASNTILRSNRGRVDQWNAGSGNSIETLSAGTIVQGNTIDGTGDPATYGANNGIAVGGAASQVLDNVVRNVRGSGINLFHGGDDRVVSGNRISHVGELPKMAGIRMFVWSGSDVMLRTLVKGNVISDVATGIGISSGPKGMVDKTKVIGNTLNGLRLELTGARDTIRSNAGVLVASVSAAPPLAGSSGRAHAALLAGLFAVAIGASRIRRRTWARRLDG